MSFFKHIYCNQDPPSDTILAINFSGSKRELKQSFARVYLELEHGDVEAFVVVRGADPSVSLPEIEGDPRVELKDLPDT